MVEKSKTPGKSRSSGDRFFIYKVGMCAALDRYSTRDHDQFDMTLAEWRVLTLLYGCLPDRCELCDLLKPTRRSQPCLRRPCSGLAFAGTR